MNDKPVIAVSGCLLGENVRYNRGNTGNRWIVRELSKHVEIVSICPEVEMGLGVPREEISLYYKSKKEFGLKTKFSNNDLTDLATDTYKKMESRLIQKDIDGIILMRKSPSCGLGNVKTIGLEKDSPVRLTQGLFAKYVSEAFPNLPKVDSGRLNNKQLRYNFLNSTFALNRFKKIPKEISALQDFHKQYKYILMECSQLKLTELGRIASNQEQKDVDTVFRDYQDLFFPTLALDPTISNKYNTLQHIMGHFKKDLDHTDKSELQVVLNDFKNGMIDYEIPLKLFHFFATKYKQKYLINQFYFNSIPKHLKYSF